jgi:predicted membrane metal-binding protein
LAGLFSSFFSRLLGAQRGAVAAVGITFYTLLVGANPSVVRAAMMGCLGLLASQVGRRLLLDGLVRRVSGLVGEYFLFTLAAQIVTFPVMVYHFQNFSLVALLAT